MNYYDYEILKSILTSGYVNHSFLETSICCSKEQISKTLNKFLFCEYLSTDMKLSDKALAAINDLSPKKAVILAAGYGSRMTPVNYEVPKALMEVNNEKLIERHIHHLHEIGIREIYVVAGYMKESFNYLVDKYNVSLIFNDRFFELNSTYSLFLANKFMDNAYIIPCDLYFKENPFNKIELYSWYMLSDKMRKGSGVAINSNNELININDDTNGNSKIGLVYLTSETACLLRKQLSIIFSQDNFSQDNIPNHSLLDIIFNKNILVFGKVIKDDFVYDINSYEQLRMLNANSSNLNFKAINIIKETLSVEDNEIKNIRALKKGMTNRSFIFSVRNKKYIMRIPGEGTDLLINRKNEYDVYNSIKNKNLCDNIVYINPSNGYKITEFIENSKVCDPNNINDLEACMKKLRDFHNQKIVVSHEFNIFEQINFYEELCQGNFSYEDYETTKKEIFSLRDYISMHIDNKCLTHIDAVPDNFLFTTDGDVRLIDWEYAGIQDPHVDIAMFCIYSLYEKNQIDQLIDIYFENKCSDEIRIKIYCYVAACGLLWSNWCEYKKSLGVEFGDYSSQQYKYAKDYYKIVKEVLNES